MVRVSDLQYRYLKSFNNGIECAWPVLHIPISLPVRLRQIILRQSANRRAKFRRLCFHHCKYFNKKQYPLEQNQRYTVFIILYLIFNIYSILRFVLYLFLIHSCNPLFSDLSLLKAKVFTVLATLNRQSEEENWCACTKGRWRRWREWKLIL